jgi:hypothetical protein
MGWKTTAPLDVVRRANRVLIAERFPGWTLEYIDGLSMQDRADILGVLNAKSKVNQLKQQTANAQQSARSKRGRSRR